MVAAFDNTSSDERMAVASFWRRSGVGNANVFVRKEVENSVGLANRPNGTSTASSSPVDSRATIERKRLVGPSTLANIPNPPPLQGVRVPRRAQVAWQSATKTSTAGGSATVARYLELLDATGESPVSVRTLRHNSHSLVADDTPASLDRSDSPTSEGMTPLYSHSTSPIGDTSMNCGTAVTRYAL